MQKVIQKYNVPTYTGLAINMKLNGKLTSSLYQFTNLSQKNIESYREYNDEWIEPQKNNSLF